MSELVTFLRVSFESFYSRSYSGVALIFFRPTMHVATRRTPQVDAQLPQESHPRPQLFGQRATP